MDAFSQAEHDSIQLARIIKKDSAFFGQVGMVHTPDEPDPDGQVAVMFDPFDAPDWFDAADVELLDSE